VLASGGRQPVSSSVHFSTLRIEKFKNPLIRCGRHLALSNRRLEADSTSWFVCTLSQETIWRGASQTDLYAFRRSPASTNIVLDTSPQFQAI